MIPSSIKRVDGRRFDELRDPKISWDPMGFALSSLIISTGQTSVLCSVSLEEGSPPWREGKGWLSAEYRLLPGSTPNRNKRELLKLSGRTQEIQRLIGRSLRAVVDLEALSEKTILIDCDVIQADAGTRTAAITGAWVALQKAFNLLCLDGTLDKNPMSHQVAAVSVGLMHCHPLLDLDYSEDSQVDVDLNVVMSSNLRLLEVQGTAERAAFTREELNKMIDLAQLGLEKLHQFQIASLEDEN